MRSLGAYRGLLPALMAGVLLVPYTKPAVCDLTNHADKPAHETHAPQGDVWAEGANSATCHEIGDCAVAHVAPILESVVSVSVLPSHREPTVVPTPCVGLLLVTNLTPPPRA